MRTNRAASQTSGPEAADQNDITIDSVFFAQTHVLEPEHPYFRLVGGKDTLIKVHVLSRSGAEAPPVKAVLKLDEQTETLTLGGPSVLPDTFVKEPGKVVHCFDDWLLPQSPASGFKRA